MDYLHRKMVEFLNKEGRFSCWTYRDNYWECLDKYAPDFNRNNESEKEPSQCVELRKLFVNNCPSQWVRHFDRKRTFEQFKKRMEKGFDPAAKPREGQDSGQEKNQKESKS